MRHQNENCIGLERRRREVEPRVEISGPLSQQKNRERRVCQVFSVTRKNCQMSIKIAQILISQEKYYILKSLQKLQRMWETCAN